VILLNEHKIHEYVDKAKVASEPIYEEIEYVIPINVFESFSQEKWSMLIDSANGSQKKYGTNRYSYILVDPFYTYSFNSNKLEKQQKFAVDPFNDLRKLSSSYQIKAIKNLPPFQGGLVGYLSYDLTHLYHPVLTPKFNDLKLPEICMGFYDLVCAFDHVKRRAYIISSGLPEVHEEKKISRAHERINWFKKQIRIFPQRKNVENINEVFINSNFTKDQYLKAVEQVIYYIKAGDIFEANLSQRFEAKLPVDFDLNDYL